jgi:hypothetical protein
VIDARWKLELLKVGRQIKVDDYMHLVFSLAAALTILTLNQNSAVTAALQCRASNLTFKS